MGKRLDNLYILIRAFIKTESIFFFPHYGIGGGERVHINVLESVKAKRKMLVFENESPAPNFLEEFLQFSDSYCVISKYKRNKLMHVLFLLILYFALILKKKSIIFGCNSIEFYRIKKFRINNKIKFIDLVHTFDSKLPKFINAHNKINKLSKFNITDTRIYIDKKSKKEFEAFYTSLPYKESVIIYNSVKFFEFSPRNSDFLVCSFVGRPDNEQKRIHLFADVLKKSIKCVANNFHFIIIGIDKSDISFSNTLGSYSFGNAEFKGVINDQHVLNRFYNQMDVIIITSKYEGFPMVLMEAMAKGVITISTNVGGISEHVKHGYNGFLIEDFYDENKITDQIIDYLKLLDEDRNLRSAMALNSYKYAKENFSFSQFESRYKALLEG